MSDSLLNENEIRKIVGDEIDRRIAFLKKLALAFFAGLTVLITIGLISKNTFLETAFGTLIDGQFGQKFDALFEKHFDTRLETNPGSVVAFSYSADAWLEPTSGNLIDESFLADYPRQHVTILLEIRHKGIDPRNVVSVELDRDPKPVWAGSDDLEVSSGKIALDDWLKHPDVARSAIPKLHVLEFSLRRPNDNKSTEINSKDRVHVRVLIKVVGLEDREK